MTWNQFFTVLAACTGCPAVTLPDSTGEDMSPYGERGSRFMSTQRVRDSGFTFERLDDWLFPVIQRIARNA